MKKLIISIIALLVMISGVTAQTKESFIVNGVSFKMVKVEGGALMMGATSDQGNVITADPAHEETVKTFYIGETEVTQDLWMAVMGSNPSSFTHTMSAKAEKLPVESVSIEDCNEFIKKLNKLTNKKFRLPTDTEWEYAARGGKKSKQTKYAGSNNIEEVGWYVQNSGKKHLNSDWRREDIRNNECKTHTVAGKAPNELGIYDMTGNVCEFTGTKYTRSKYKSERSKYIVKGGSYMDHVDNCVIARIGMLSSGDKYSGHGLRLALSE